MGNLDHIFCRNVAFLTVTHCQFLGVGHEMMRLWYLYLKLNWIIGCDQHNHQRFYLVNYLIVI